MSDNNESFLDALSPGKKDGNNEESEDGDSGSTRFQDMMKAAKQSGAAEAQREPTPIMNPFLNPVSSTPQPPVNPDDLSVEEQARMFREMMAGKQQSSPPPADILQAPLEKVARGGADRAGRPAGRNRDADMIANASDLYFAQLKRDSTVRTIGRIQGDKDVSESVFEDEGIEQLSGLLKENPYLKRLVHIYIRRMRACTMHYRDFLCRLYCVLSKQICLFFLFLGCLQSKRGRVGIV